MQPTAAWTGDLAAPVALMGEPDRVTAVWRSGVPQLVADLPPPPGTEAPGPRALRSALLVPLTAQDHILGVLLLGRTTAGRPYAPEDLVLAEGLARRAAEALAQAQLREDRQAAEQAAAEVHARLEALITSLPSGIGYLDHELRYQLVNPALAALNGRTPEEHLGHALAEVLPGLAPQLEPLFGQVLATGEAMRDLELHGQPCSLDGAPHDWQISAFPVLGTAGAVAGVGVTVTDVTQRTRTAAALRASEERFRLLAEHAHDVLYRVRVAPTLALEYLSPAIARLTGYPREAFYGDITLGLQLVLPEDRPGFQQLLTGWHDQPPPAVIRWRHQDGAIRWAELHSWPVAVEAGQPVVFEGIARDITARKQAEEALRTSQENLASLIENTDGVIWSVDAQYRLIIANTRFYDLARAASGRTVAPGERILSSTIPADEQELRAYYDRALAGEAFSLELPTRVAAAPRIFAYRFGPIRTAAGAITGVTVIGLDSTERLQVAQALHDLERKLGTLFAILPVGISILDAAGDVVYANPALEQILQLDQASLHRGAYQARQYLRSDGTSMPAVEYASARALQAHQAVANLETGIVTEAGAVIWTSVSAAPVDFPDWHVVVVTTDITERKQAEAALRASEERLQLAMAGGNIGTFLWYPEADRGEPDARMLALCGLPADGALSLAVALGSLIHPDDRAGYAAALARATDPAGDGVLRAEMRLLPPDGSTRWLAITAQTFFAAAPPRAVRMSGIAADITERKQAEAALQASTAKLQAALESMTDAVFISDTDGRFLDFNDAFATFHKFRTKAECATTLAAYPAFLDVYLATGELVPLEQWVMPRALRGETGTNAEYTLRRKDTGETWVGSYSFAPIRDPAGAIIGAVIVGRDITAQHQTQRALAYERQQLAAVVRTMHEGVIAARPDGSLALINPADLQLRGLDPAQPPASMAELAQRTPHQLVGTEGQALAPEEWPLPRVLRGESFVGLELRVRSTRGEPERWLRFNGGPVYDEGGRLILGVVTAHDITQPKWDAAALAARTDTLSQTNAALTRALRLKDEFLAMMSHELRTPLNVVLGITEALNEELYGPISDRQRQALAQVTQSGRHLLAILSDILDLAQLEAGKAPLDAQPVDVDTLCRAALQFVQAPAQAKGIKLLRTVAVGVEGLRADARRLTQILVNLLDNAVKFTPQGGTVGLEVTGDGGQAHIQFVVWDTGIGIAEADFARLFQPFTQVDGRLSRQYGGIGLGLTLVHRLVDLHGGSISLASTPGQGSRFTVSLPWASADNVAPLAAQAAAPAAPSWAQPPRVLIADDHEPTLQFYADLLRQEGCEVVPARTGTEALAMVRAHQPDVAVVDIQMPGMDGLTAIRQIRADLNVARIPIIALTALAMPGDREHCLAAGATVYLAKPVGIRTLITTIADVLMGSSTGGIGE
ncbi:MAG: PAS domain-containing protein [Chloroflexales bacterium]|nr:PAS domain-containing protein [Chloroflexales bacterium]